MPKPVVGSIAGSAAGIGAAFAMSCDLRIMSDDSYIMSVFSILLLCLMEDYHGSFQNIWIRKHMNMQLKLRKFQQMNVYNMELL